MKLKGQWSWAPETGKWKPKANLRPRAGSSTTTPEAEPGEEPSPAQPSPCPPAEATEAEAAVAPAAAAATEPPPAQPDPVPDPVPVSALHVDAALPQSPERSRDAGGAESGDDSQDSSRSRPRGRGRDRPKLASNYKERTWRSTILFSARMLLGGIIVVYSMRARVSSLLLCLTLVHPMLPSQVGSRPVLPSKDLGLLPYLTQWHPCSSKHASIRWSVSCCCSPRWLGSPPDQGDGQMCIVHSNGICPERV